MATEEVSNKALILKDLLQAGALLEESDMEIRIGSIKLEVPEDSNAILVKNLFLSCDHYMLRRMVKMEGHYCLGRRPFTPGLPLQGYGVSRVVESANPDFKKGDLVWGATNWEEYTYITDGLMIKIPQIDVPLSYYTGILGSPGMTAFAGFYEVCSPKEGEYVYVSEADGAIGQLVGQFAKLSGCHVVGSAESNDKVDLLKNKLGFDEAFNYKEEPDLAVALNRCFPEGIDIYFANVGGKMLDAVLANMRYRGRIALCGLISQHDRKPQPEGVYNLGYLIFKHIHMEGFMVTEYYSLYPKYLEMILPHIGEGNIVYNENIVKGLESGPGALAGMFSGHDVVKQVIQLATE